MLDNIFNLFSRVKLWPAGGLLLLLAVSVPLEASARQPVLTENELKEIIGAPNVKDEFQNIEAARLAENAPALLGILTGIEQPSDQNPAARAYLRYTAIMAFADMTESAEVRSHLLAYLDPRQTPAPGIAVWREDDGHRTKVVAFDPAAAARFSLGNWNQRAWYRKGRSDLASGTTDFVTEWLNAQRAAGGGLAATGLIDAVSSSSVAELSSLPAQLHLLLAKGQPVAELARVVAIRLADEQLARAIIQKADSANAIAFLAETEAFPSPVQLRLMALAAERSDLGSAAMYRMAAVGTAASRNALLDRLGSRELGSSAAAALARFPAPELLEELASVVTDSTNPLARRRAVLSLHLMEGAAGQDLLAQLSRSSRLDPELRNLIASKLP